ncbi:hypothetical protein ACGH52_28235 [Streptomyces sp. BBFR25]|uniref:hypothetical protein n=1 Tax=unclassified Streptomyces TaxID=2593676 RepID=UPI00097900C9|nr:hypothetical protein [Streptomyces sp. M1013]OMI86597.1 hypothetical protein BSZ07_28240 [Streptomyces sp. M1013]
MVKVVRRLSLYCVLPLVLVLTAAYTWYRVSDTGNGWRYKDKLATYCGGLIPYDEATAFTGLNTDSLSRDRVEGYGADRFRSCRIANLTVSIGLVLADAVRSDSVPNMLSALNRERSDHLPVGLGGGWRGYTDGRTTAVVLPCTNKDASLVVNIAGDSSHENGDGSRAVGELATAIARKAADRRSCEASFGRRLPEISLWNGQYSPAGTSGTCEGLQIPESQWVDWVQGSVASDSSPLELCLLGESKARDEVLYSMEASFGPYAQRLRSADHDEPWPEPGLTHDSATATASCPGSTVPAVFRIHATVYAAPTEQFLRSALHTFAERSAARHGCTGLELPD